MPSLAQLKIAMYVPIILVSLIFAGLLAVILFILQLSYIWAIVLTGLFILIQYLIGPAIVRASTRLKYVKKGENPWLETTVNELAQKSGIPTPRLAIVSDPAPNAFVFGRTRQDATLAVHEGLLRNLNEDEVRGVVGHELGHLRHRDFLIMTVMSAIPLIAYLLFRGAFGAAWMSGGSSRRKNGGGLAAALIVIAILSYVIYIISMLFVMRLSRLREHYADAYSAYVTGSPRSLESALTKITYGLSLAPRVENQAARTLYIGDPALAKLEIQNIVNHKEEYDLDKDGVLDEKELELAMEKEAKSTWLTISRLFQTHPATFQRILLLREIDNEMTTGKYSSERMYAHV